MNILATEICLSQVIEYGHQIRTVYGRKQTVYDRIRLYLYSLRTVFCRKPGRWFTTVFQWKYCRILIVYRPYTVVFPLKYGRKSSTWFTGRIQCFTTVSAPYSSSWDGEHIDQTPTAEDESIEDLLKRWFIVLLRNRRSIKKINTSICNNSTDVFTLVLSPFRSRDSRQKYPHVFVDWSIQSFHWGSNVIRFDQFQSSMTTEKIISVQWEKRSF